ncbi:hypothetical protein [Rossellomorea marisflavi]|nr:hypothetical protein [Rossellomorea marisflavi]
MEAKFAPLGEMVSSAMVADNQMMYTYCIVLMTIPTTSLFSEGSDLVRPM